MPLFFYAFALYWKKSATFVAPKYGGLLPKVPYFWTKTAALLMAKPHGLWFNDLGSHICKVGDENVKVENKSNIILQNEKLFVILHRR